MIRKYVFILILATFCMSLSIGCKTIEVKGGPLPISGLFDGVYRGTAKDGPVKVIVDVTIEDQKITNIDLIKHRNWKGGAAEKTIPDRIIKHQSTKVDAVSGATVSSRAIMNAVQNAIDHSANQ